MGEIVEDKSRESSSRCAYLSKDWVDEYITEMEIKGCTILSHLSRRLFDTSFIGKFNDQEEKSKMHDIWERVVMEEVG